MGLDITAYRQLREAPNAELDVDGYPKGRETKLYENTDFPGRMEGLKDRGVYAYEEAFGFRAGSYGGYNQWRNELARMAGYPLGRDEPMLSHAASAWSGKLDHMPFVELVNFADNEGTIGPVVAAKLAKDFADWDDRAQVFGSNLNEEWFYRQYCNWRKAFEMAADAGAVSFH